MTNDKEAIIMCCIRLEERRREMEKIVTELLLEWFKEYGREYPWRKETDPYRILMAEIMLQRTKADQVRRVYQPFLERFPNIHRLAAAAPEELEGILGMLGLRWRTRKVKELAEVIISQHNGHIPSSREGLISLPGVGDYVADAVLCFAYGMDVAVVDANVCRVIGRVFGIKPSGEARRNPVFRQIAQRLIPSKKAREFNHAIIDFAALICTPRNPKCDKCILRELCSFYKVVQYKNDGAQLSSR